MEQKKHICKSHELVNLSSDYPWLVAHNLDPKEDDTGDQIFYRVDDPMCHYRCRIPELVGRRIRGCYHGWMILSKRNPQDMEWSLWNPIISKLIHLPRMILKDKDDDFRNCCLSSPPDDPDSVLLLMRSTEPNIVYVFCNDKRRKRVRLWMEMSYSKQMKNISGSSADDGFLLLEPTCCNGNIYAFSFVSDPPLLIQVQIHVVKEKKVVINLVPLVKLPWSDYKSRIEDCFFLKGSCTQLFAITLWDDKDEKPSDVCLFKLDMSSMVWTEIKDLKDTVFFVSLASDNDLVYSSPPVASELGGGYIHILADDIGDVIYSYNIKDKTISMSSMHCLGLPICKSISVWTIPEFRVYGKPNYCNDHGYDDQVLLVTSANDDEVEETKNEACLLNIPFDVLEIIVKFCVGIEYLNFRATCKLCRLAAPMSQWSKEWMTLPWLMVLDKDRGIITFTDPMFGDNNYVIKASPELFFHHRILCSRHGWLLLYIDHCCVAFFNPFTRDIRKLPPINIYESFSFSAPPTSPDCMVVAFSPTCSTNVFYHRVGGEPFWHGFELDFGDDDGLPSFGFPTFCGEDVYTLFNGGGLEVFREIDHDDNFSWETIVNTPRTSTTAKYYQVKCDQHHLLVMVEEYGKSVEVFKLNDYRQEWEEIDGLGRHVIYICDTSCVCMDAKTPEMENKIYFPRLHKENGKIVFYSLETCMFHTFNGRNVEQNLTDLFGTKQTVYVNAWIEPTWS